VLGFLAGFVAQAALRVVLLDAVPLAVLMPALGVPALIYTFYMVTDPATTPSRPRAQAVFGASVAGVYLVLVVLHVAFGLFFALTVVCAARGVGLWAHALIVREGVPAPGVREPAAG
jgi:hypothetical protein